MIKLFVEADARGSSFLVNDPVFNLFVEAISTFPDSFVPVKTRTKESLQQWHFVANLHKDVRNFPFSFR